MQLNLKSLARETTPRVGKFQLTERLPHHVDGPCELTCSYQVTRQNKLCLLALKIEGNIQLTCQRCAEVYMYAYHRETVIAVCRDDDRAAQLMDTYDCIVGGEELDLIDILTDDLCLYLPEKHELLSLCDPDVTQWLDAQGAAILN